MLEAAALRKFIFGTPEGKMFTRRELIQIAVKGKTVDRLILKFIKKRIMVRVAWGVYVRLKHGQLGPSVTEVAKVRIEALGREVIRTDKDLAREHGIVGKGEHNYAFETDGATSSFRTFTKEGKSKVHLRNRPARKLLIGRTTAGRAIKALWFLGRRNLTRWAVQQTTSTFGRNERTELRQSVRWMPGWLGEFIYYF